MTFSRRIEVGDPWSPQAQNREGAILTSAGRKMRFFRVWMFLDLAVVLGPLPVALVPQWWVAEWSIMGHSSEHRD